MDPILQKFKLVFLEEASGLLDNMEKDLLDLESCPNNLDLIESIFRAMHSIKGASGMYGFRYVAEFTHSLENIYQHIRDKKTIFNKSVFDITFSSVDHIRKLLNDEQLSNQENLLNHHSIIAEIQQIADPLTDSIPENQSHSETSSSPCTWQIFLRASEHIYFRGISITGLFHDLSLLGTYDLSKVESLSHGEADIWSIILYTNASENEIREVFMFVEDDCTITPILNQNLFEVSEENPKNEQSIMDFIKGNDSSPEKNVKVEKGKKNVKRIPVDSSKLDHLMFLVSELITLNSQFNSRLHQNKDEQMNAFIERLDDLSKQFRNNALDIRLIPLSDTIFRFKRLIRDLSLQLKKNVILLTEGIDTEVDKGTVDHLNDPLMHIIRNCIDHGIELPSVRKQKGKPESGTIKITASNSGNLVIIRIEDDGMGIDPKKIRIKAIEKGIIKASDKLSTKQLLDLIFLPGFSTASDITEVSGRGVGMDVVKRKIKEIGGEVMVDSQPGIGTSFTLHLHQSISILDTLLFKVQDMLFTVSISDVYVCLQLSADELQKRRQTCTFPFENQLIPFLDLRLKFQLTGQYDAETKAIILKYNDSYLALLTDRIIGGHQAVLKSLGPIFRDQKLIVAASQLGDGKLAFMIDTNNLFLHYRDTIN